MNQSHFQQHHLLSAIVNLGLEDLIIVFKLQLIHLNNPFNKNRADAINKLIVSSCNAGIVSIID